MSKFFEFSHTNKHLRIFKFHTSGAKEIYWIDIKFLLNCERKFLKSTFFNSIQVQIFCEISWNLKQEIYSDVRIQSSIVEAFIHQPYPK